MSDSFVTDSGTATPSSHILNIKSGNSTVNSGSSVLFTGSGSTVELNVTDASANTMIGVDSGNLTMTASGNVALGRNTGKAFTNNPVNNTLIGDQAGHAITTGSTNTMVGSGAGFFLNIGADNTFIGYVAGENIIDGEANTLIGRSAGLNYTGSESSNICIGNSYFWRSW